MFPELEIRLVEKSDVPALGTITVAASKTAFDGNIPPETVDRSWTAEVSSSNWYRLLWEEQPAERDRFDVAVVDNRVIGFIWDSPGAHTPGFEWSIRGLYVHPEFHNQGIGRKLISHVARRIIDAGITTLEIGCAKNNPFCGFYRYLGGVEVGRKDLMIDDYETEEIMFGWTDLSVLVGEIG